MAVLSAFWKAQPPLSLLAKRLLCRPNPFLSLFGLDLCRPHLPEFLPPSCLTPQLISSGVAQEADNTPSSVRGRSRTSRARCTFLAVTFSSQMLVSPGRQRVFEPELLSAGGFSTQPPPYLLDKARPCPGHPSVLNQLQPSRAELVS